MESDHSTVLSLGKHGGEHRDREVTCRGGKWKHGRAQRQGTITLTFSVNQHRDMFWSLHLKHRESLNLCRVK